MSNGDSDRRMALMERVASAYSDVDSSNPLKLVDFIANVVEWSSNDGLPPNQFVMTDIIYVIRTKLYPDVVGVNAMFEWDRRCAQALSQLLFPGVPRPAWARRALDMISDDLGDRTSHSTTTAGGEVVNDSGAPMAYDESKSCIAALLRDASEVINAVTANDSFVVRKKVLHNMGRTNLLLAQDTFGQTLLHYAAFGSCTDTMRYLIMDGLSPNTADFQGRSCVHVAAQAMHVTAASFLIKSGAMSSMCAIDNNGELPIHLFLRAAATSPWRRRMSSSQVVEGAFGLMRHPSSDMWRYYPEWTDFRVRVTEGGGEGASRVVPRPSILLQLMSLGDYAIATAVIPAAAGAVKHWLNITKQSDSVVSDSPSGLLEDRGPPMSEIKLQVQVMIAEAVRRKRVRVLLLLISTFGDMFDIFGLRDDKTAPEERFTFFFRCLELAVLGGCLRTAIALIDTASAAFAAIAQAAQNHTLRWIPSCFLNFAIARGDTLMLKLCLERLGAAMDLWVCFPGLSASQAVHKNPVTQDIVSSNEAFLSTLLHNNLDAGFFDAKFIAMQLHLVSPIAMTCLVDDVVALELILSR